MKKMKKLVGIVAVLGLSLGLVYYFTAMRGDALTADPAKTKPAAPGMPVIAAPVMNEAVPERVATIGTVEPVASVRLRSRLDSAIANVHVQEGRTVREGDLMFELDSRPTLAALKQAEAALARDRVQWANAKRDLGRMNERLNSRQQIDQARTAVAAQEAVVQTGEALVEAAKVQHSYTAIRAPIAGRLGAIALKKGNTVRAADATPLVTINQMQPIYVSFALPQQRLAAVRKAMGDRSLEAIATVPGDDGKPIVGRVSFIDNAVHPASGTVELKALFGNHDERLWPGAHVDIVLTIRVQDDAIAIPSRAVQQSQSGTIVFVIKEDLTVEARPIVVDRIADNVTVVSQGVNPGERVVVEGQLRLTNGAKVEIVSTEGESRP